MRRFRKIGPLLLCTMLLACGCTDTQEVVSDEVTITEAPEISVTPEVTEEEKLHPITAEGMDYLSVEGIVLEPGVEIAMLATDSENPFYDMVKKGAVQAIKDLNTANGYSGKKKITLTFTAPKEENAIDQINIIDQFLDKAPNALCIAFTDASACKTQLEMAKNNGIRLIAFDAPDESGITEAIIATDNDTAAAITAKKMFESMEDGSKIAIIAHNSTKQTGIDRYRAITGEYTKNYAAKNLRFVDVVYVAQDERTEEEILDELFSAHPDLAGIICTDLSTTEMVIDYARETDGSDFLITGYDISEKIVQAATDRTILGTTAQDPYGMGYATVIAAARSIAGMENAKTIYSDYLWIDETNVDSKEAVSLFTW